MKTVYTDWNEINELAVKYKQQWAVYLSNNLQYDEEDEHIWKAVLKRCELYKNFITPDDIMSIMHGGLFFFETEQEMELFFNIFTEPPVYSSKIFVVSYDNKGNALSENT